MTFRVVLDRIYLFVYLFNRLAKTTMDAADLFVDQSEHLSLGFRNFSLALEKCAANRDALESALSSSLIESLGRILETDIGNANKAAKSLHQGK